MIRTSVLIRKQVGRTEHAMSDNTEITVRRYFCSCISKTTIGRAEAYFWASVGYECRVNETAIENGMPAATYKYFISCKPLVQLSLGNKLNGDRI